MTPDRWRRVQEVFAAVTEREPGSRAAFLEEACRNDPELRTEVESLLSSLGSAPSDFLESPAIQGAAKLSPNKPDSEPLGKGMRLGPYEIREALGAGGMGEVYRASDPRLGREVALKVLPAELSADQERLRRFEREARSASSLNHPNIVTIYEIGSFKGMSYIAMEKVDGQTLRELVNGPLSTKKLLQIAPQIADGLAKAHEAGIVHRDLKPENVMVTKDGLVKILDFGLAKLTAPGSGSGEGAKLPAMSETIPGVIFGTVGYMSPEQANSERVDFRSDQFSFGSMLYEMTTGKRAFAKKTAIDTLGAILNEDPQPIATVNPKVPTQLRWIVERCLAKDPRQRYSSTDDLARDLAMLRDHLSEASGEPAVALSSWRRRLGRILSLAAAVFAATALAVFLVGRFSGRAPPPLFRRLTFRRGYIPSARFGVDSKTVAYSAAWDGGPPELFSTRSDSPESRPLELGAATLLAVSATGQMAIARSPESYGSRPFYRGMLAQASLGGGAARDLVDAVMAADWDSAGKEIAVVRIPEKRARLEFPAGKALFESEGYISRVRISPRGNLIAFLDHPHWSDDRGSLVVVDVHSKKKKTLTSEWETANGLAWAPGGDEVWITAARSGSATDLYAVDLAGRQRVIQRIGARLVLHDISEDGRVLLTEENQRYGITGLAPSDGRERDLSWFDYSVLTPGALSSDGRQIVFAEETETNGPEYAVCIRKVDGSPPVRLGEGLPTSLSPDGKWVLAVRPSAPELFLLPTGPGQKKRLEPHGLQQNWARWFPDGKQILVWGNEPGKQWRGYVQPADGGPPRPLTPEGVFGILISPDGKRVIAMERNRNAFFVYPAAGGEPVSLPGLRQGDWPTQWGDDGETLYVVPENSRQIYRVNFSTGERTLWREISPSDPAGFLAVEDVEVSRDGRQIVYSYARIMSDLYVVDGLK